MEDRNIVQTSVLPLTTIGLITFIVFLVLKLCNILPSEFTWFWVWFPLWIPWAIEIILVGVVLLIYFIINKS